MNTLQIANIHKSYQHFQALKGVNFTIPQGKVFGLLGPNGAGKSTLIRIIQGIYAQDSGKVVYMEKESNPEKYRVNIGYLPEERGLYPDMKVSEQLLFFAKLHNVPVDTAKKRITQYLKHFDLYEKRDQKLNSFSKGMQQNVQFISAIIHDPALLILDEPFTGLDPVNTKRIKDFIRDYIKSGHTVLLSTHRMEQVESLADEICLINKGQVVLTGNIEEIKESYRQNRYFIKSSQPLHKIDTIKGIIGIEQSEKELIFEAELGLIPDILKEIAKHNDLLEFREILPTLEDIFIQNVSNNKK
jgi:ABC-2 type transport system ATP-binding protein